MASTLAKAAVSSHPLSLDVPRRMAKADVQKMDIDWAKAIGAAVERAIAMAGWSQKEAAAQIDVDAAEFAKWIKGDRRPQFDKLFAVEALQGPLILALGRLSQTTEVIAHVRVRMPA